MRSIYKKTGFTVNVFMELLIEGQLHKEILFC